MKSPCAKNLFGLKLILIMGALAKFVKDVNCSSKDVSVLCGLDEQYSCSRLVGKIGESLHIQYAVGTPDFRTLVVSFNGSEIIMGPYEVNGGYVKDPRLSYKDISGES